MYITDNKILDSITEIGNDYIPPSLTCKNGKQFELLSTNINVKGIYHISSYTYIMHRYLCMCIDHDISFPYS